MINFIAHYPWSQYKHKLNNLEMLDIEKKWHKSVSQKDLVSFIVNNLATSLFARGSGKVTSDRVRVREPKQDF